MFILNTEHYRTDCMNLGRIRKALDYAIESHGNQLRKGTGIPYVLHLMQVAGIVADYGGTEEQVIAAILHDVPEDCGGDGRKKLEQLRIKFGNAVAQIVHDCTDSWEARKKPWRERKEAHIKYVQEQMHVDSVLVCAADKLHNSSCTIIDMRRQGLKAFDKFKSDASGVCWYYVEMAKALSVRNNCLITQQLKRTVNQLRLFVNWCSVGGEFPAQ